MMQTLSMLMRKDLAQQRQRLLLGCVLMFFFGLGARANPGSGISLVASALSGLVMVTAMGSAYDDDQGGLVFLRSLPLPPHELVAGKFLSILAFALAYVGAGLLPILLAARQTLLLPMLAATGVSAAAGLILAGIVLVVFYRYGYRAVQHAFLYAVVGLVALSFLVSFVGQKSGVTGPPSWVSNLVGGINEWLSVSGGRVALLAALFTIGIYLVLGWRATHNLRVRDL